MVNMGGKTRTIALVGATTLWIVTLVLTGADFAIEGQFGAHRILISATACTTVLLGVYVMIERLVVPHLLDIKRHQYDVKEAFQLGLTIGDRRAQRDVVVPMRARRPVPLDYDTPNGEARSMPGVPNAH